MREVYMPYNSEMVRAILEGRKTVTHRPIKFPKWIEPSEYDEAIKAINKSSHMAICERGPADGIIGRWKCPYGEPGDLMCVREAYRFDRMFGHLPPRLVPVAAAVEYAVNPNVKLEFPGEWYPSIHMPKWACRIKKPIISVRAERIQDITPEDCIAEGLISYLREHEACCELREKFAALYNSIYPGAWERNEWSWRIEWEGGK